MSYTDKITVSETFVRGALEAANKIVYRNRLERYGNASQLVKDAISFRDEIIDRFIDNYIECFSDMIEWDAYDIIDDWYGGEEKSYEDIRHQIRLDEHQEEEDVNLQREYDWNEDQLNEIHDWCNDNNFWYDDDYELAVEDFISYNV